jgi:hypothetical protein
MQQSIWAVVGAALLVFCAAKYGQTHAQVQAAGKFEVNAGSLTCNGAGGVGFVVGSSKDLNFLLSRSDGIAESYRGSIKKYGVDIGFAKEAHVAWLVFARGAVASGALAGNYAGVTAAAAAGLGANVLVGGISKQITQQPVSVEGSVGLNVAAGIADVQLTAGR